MLTFYVLYPLNCCPTFTTNLDPYLLNRDGLYLTGWVLMHAKWRASRQFVEQLAPVYFRAYHNY